MTKFANLRTALGMLFWLVVVVPATAEEEMNIEEILEHTGILTQYREMSIIVERTADELAAVSADQNFKKDFLNASREVFNPDEMISECIAIFKARFPVEFSVPISQFLRTPLGERINETELYASSTVNKDIVESVGGDIFSILPEEDPERLHLYERMINDLGFQEHGEALALNMGYAMLVGVFASGKGPVTIPHDQIKFLLEAGRSEMSREIEKKIMVNTAFAYRDISLQEMEIYLTFLQTEAAEKFYEILFFSFNKILSERAQKFGERLTELRNSRKT